MIISRHVQNTKKQTNKKLSDMMHPNPPPPNQVLCFVLALTQQASSDLLHVLAYVKIWLFFF